MSSSISTDPIASLQQCVELAGDVSCHDEANAVFSSIKHHLHQENPLVADLVQLLWNEVLTARRSATFWEQMSNAERELTEQMAASHLQLQQNYLRLIQEQ